MTNTEERAMAKHLGVDALEIDLAQLETERALSLSALERIRDLAMISAARNGHLFETHEIRRVAQETIDALARVPR